MNNEKIIWDYLKTKGLNDYGTAGLMGNLYAESALNPQNLQNNYEKKLGYSDSTYTAAVDNNSYTNFIKDSAGYGLAQWTYWSRKQNLYNYAKSMKKSIGDLNMQLDFLMIELANYKLIDGLKNAKSVLEASNLILLNFEKPADQSDAVQKKRASYGQIYYDKYAKISTLTPVQISTVDTTSKPTISIAQGGSLMKYSSSNKPLQCMMTKSTCYRQTRKMEVKGILWHSTGANNPNLARYVQPSENDPNYQQLINLLGRNSNGNDWNHIEHQAGLNCWIGKLKDGTVTTVQTMPWDYRPWGCGSGPKGSCNTGWIQFEICEDALNDKNYFEKAYKEACEITAYLCTLYGIDPHGTVSVSGVKVPTILCHHDSYKLGLGSNHGDIDHWFPKFGKSMATARNDVAALMKQLNPIIAEPIKEEEEVTQEQFNQMMNVYLTDLAKKNPGDWSKDAREFCESNGIINGDAEGNKMYKKFLTREEMAAIVYRLHGKE